LQFAPQQCCAGRALAPGRYQLPGWLGLALSLEIDQGWRVINEEMAGLFALVKGRNSLSDASDWIAFVPIRRADPLRQLLGEFQQAPQLHAIQEITPASVAGFVGLQLDASAQPAPDVGGVPQDSVVAGTQKLPVMEQFVSPGFQWYTSTPEARLRFMALAVGDQTMLVYLESPADAFDRFVIEADQVLQTAAILEK
jgi:hypothetical protein